MWSLQLLQSASQPAYTHGALLQSYISLTTIDTRHVANPTNGRFAYIVRGLQHVQVHVVFGPQNDIQTPINTFAYSMHPASWRATLKSRASAEMPRWTGEQTLLTCRVLHAVTSFFCGRQQWEGRAQVSVAFRPSIDCGHYTCASLNHSCFAKTLHGSRQAGSRQVG